MKKIAAIVACLLLPFPSFGQTTKTAIISDISTNFADNTSNAITAAMLRMVTTEIVSSYVDWLTCTTTPTAGSLIYYLTNSVPACLAPGLVGQYFRSGVTPSWESLASGLTSGQNILITGSITPTIAVSPTVILSTVNVGSGALMANATAVTLGVTPVMATSMTGASTQTFTNAPCSHTTTATWVPIEITGKLGTFYIPACQ